MNEVTERITVPPIECEPWCEYQDGHPNERFREDQQCFSHHGLRVPLSLHPLIVDDEPGPDGPGWEPEPDAVQVFAAKHADGMSQVWLVHEPLHGVEQWKYTPAEAQTLLEALQLVLGQIGATG